MKRGSWLIAFTVCFVWMLGGCKETDDPQSISIVLQGDPATRAAVEQVLEENPQFFIPGTQTKYSMIVVEPDSDVDYKIVQVTPDPTVDYKVIIIDPGSGQELADLSHPLGDVIREKLREKQAQSE